MNIIKFPSYGAIEINSGIVRQSMVQDHAGTRLLDEAGKFVFFIDYVEPDGCRVGLWSGEDRAEAFREARLAAQDFGVRVRDRTGGVHV